MADQDPANNPPNSNRNTAEPRTDADHRDDIARLLEDQAALQQDMRNATARLNQFIDTATRQLANPLATIGGITVSLRNPTDDQSNMFIVRVSPPVDESRPSDGARNDQLKDSQKSNLEKGAHIEELKKRRDQRRSSDGQAPAQGTQEPTAGPDASQQNNESAIAESSKDARDRAARRDHAPSFSSAQHTNMRTDEEIALAMQQYEYDEDSPEEYDSRLPPDSPVSGLDDLTNEDLDWINREDLDEDAPKQGKVDKGKGRARDAMTKSPSKTNNHSDTQSLAPAPKDTSVANDASLSGVKSADAGDGTAPEKPRHMTQRQFDREQQKRKDAAELKIKRERRGEKTWYKDPSTGKEVLGYVDGEVTHKDILPPDPEPSRRSRGSRPSVPSTKLPGTSAIRDGTANATSSGRNVVTAPNDAEKGNDRKDQQVQKHLKQSSNAEDAEVPDAFEVAFESDDDGSEAVALDRGPMNDEEGSVIYSGDDELEARDPSEAHRFANRPKQITKHSNSRQPTTAYGNRHRKSASSWAGPSSVRAGEKRKTESNAQSAEAADDEDAAQSPTKKQKPSKPAKSEQAEVGDTKKKNDRLGLDFPRRRP